MRKKLHLTIKQQMFIEEYIRNRGNASDAYRYAYDAENMGTKTINTNAIRLIQKDKIRIAIDRERARLNRDHGTRVKEIEDNLFSIYERSLETDQLNTARACMMDIAKLNGLIVNKEHRIVDGTIEHSHVSILQAIKNHRTIQKTVPIEQLENDNVLMLKDKSA